MESLATPPWETPDWWKMNDVERRKATAEWAWANSDHFAKVIRDVMDERGIEYVAAAMYYGSVGYYPPRTAVNVIKEWLERQNAEGLDWEAKHSGGSERTICLYYWNRTYEIYSDVIKFEGINEKERERILNTVRKALRGEPWWE